MAEGKDTVITRKGIRNVNQLLQNTPVNGDIGLLMDQKQKALSEFLNTIGIYSIGEKRERYIQSEIETTEGTVSNTMDSIIKTANKGFDAANELWGPNMKLISCEAIDEDLSDEKLEDENIQDGQEDGQKGDGNDENED